MPTRPRLVSSIPFWILVVASLAAGLAGAKLLIDQLASMTATLTDGTATGVDVYVGQSIAVVGAILLGAGVVGLLLALTVASLATLRPRPAVEVVEPIDWTSEGEIDQSDVEVVEAQVTEPAAPAAAAPVAPATAPAPEAPKTAAAEGEASTPPEGTPSR